MEKKFTKYEWRKAHQKVFQARDEYIESAKSEQATAGDVMLAKGAYENAKEEAARRYIEYLSEGDAQIESEGG